MVFDEMGLFLKERLLQNDPTFPPMVVERFFRILADAKSLLQIGSDGGFVLALTLFKMVEALQIKTIDEMIETLEAELNGTGGTLPAPSADVSASVRPAPQTAATPAAAQTQTSNRNPAATRPDPAMRFKKLVEKIYDRNAQLGKAFEESIEFVDFATGTLSWTSRAEGENRELLKNHFGVVRMFVQEIFGVGTKIALVKPPQASEPAAPSQNTKSAPEPTLPDANGAQASGSMIEETEFSQPSGCVAGTCENPDTPAKEMDAKEILNDPMVKKAQELFGAEKIVIRAKV
jgi:DNA polymerase-3 subunit gamma/tau